MKYCENCHVAFEQPGCPLCGSKKSRPVCEEDFCLLTEEHRCDCEELISIFGENGIPCSALPYGSGTETRLGLPLSNYRLFIPYHSLEKARKIVQENENLITDGLRENLLANVEQFNISQKSEKKIRKKIKLSEDEDFFDYCISLVEGANKIVDEGTITGCTKGGHYLFCFSDNAILTFNSATFEIISLQLRK